MNHVRYWATFLLIQLSHIFHLCHTSFRKIFSNSYLLICHTLSRFQRFDKIYLTVFAETNFLAYFISGTEEIDTLDFCSYILTRVGRYTSHFSDAILRRLTHARKSTGHTRDVRNSFPHCDMFALDTLERAPIIQIILFFFFFYVSAM